MKKKLTLKNAAVSAGVFSAAMVPQYCEADIVTVGGDGGVGRVSLVNNNTGENLGGLLASPISWTTSTTYNYIRIGGPVAANSAGDFARSSVSTFGVLDNGGNQALFLDSVGAQNGAILASDDNWMPGHFNVNGVNGGNAIFGWAHIEFQAVRGAPELISFTYDDDAIDTTAFAKPIGGFSVPAAVPEPSSLAGLALLACGAAGVRRRRVATSEPSNN